MGIFRTLMKSLAGMSTRELELLRRFIERANPPPILHRYRGASKWAIKELTVPEVHVAGVEDMNDPFEYRAPVIIDIEKLRSAMHELARVQLGMDHDAAHSEALSVNENTAKLLQQGIEELRTSSGLVCCSSNPLSNRMWAYYGGAHKGICVSYSTNFFPFCFARQVTYADPSDPIDLLDTLKQDPSLLADQVSCRKGVEWEFEQEFRIPIGPIPEGQTRLLPIPPEAIVEIRLGAKIRPDFREDVVNAARRLPRCPRIIQMGCNHENFQLTELAVIPRNTLDSKRC